ELQQCRGVIDEGDTELAVTDARRRRRSERGVEVVAPRAPLARQLPFQERLFALRSGIRVVKTTAVEMIGARAAVARRGEKKALQRDRAACRRGGNQCLGRPAHSGIS